MKFPSEAEMQLPSPNSLVQYTGIQHCTDDATSCCDVIVHRYDVTARRCDVTAEHDHQFPDTHYSTNENRLLVKLNLSVNSSLPFVDLCKNASDC
jgi:hypothetical protein